MKRFYCSVCKRIKRVRSYPASVANPSAELPQDRIGECSRHTRIRPFKAPVTVWKPANEVQAELRMKSRKKVR